MSFKSAFISGPITNNEDYKEDFQKAEEFLDKQEIYAEIVNPTKSIDENSSWTDAMIQNIDDIFCLSRINMQVVMYMLEGWEDSVGSRIEFAIARNLGFEIINEDKELY